MPYAIRFSLPGYDALTDTNPDHFAYVADEDWPLVKEKERNYITIAASTTLTIAHNLGYVPNVLVEGRTGIDEWTQIMGDSTDVSAYVEIDTTNIYIRNGTSNAMQFVYIIFYDRQV